jgi:cytochrome c peroxidase
MKKIYALTAVVLLVAVAYSCKKNSGTSAPAQITLNLPASPDLYYTSSGPTPQYNDSMNKVATLGRVLFYDAHLSINNTIACASCHKQALAFSDNTAFSVGYEGKVTRRNSLGINTLSRAGSLFWDGRETSITNLALRPLTNHVEMGIDDPNTLPDKLSALPYYSALFANAFHGDKTITMDRIASALGTFMNAITATNSRFDQYNQGNTSALTAQEINGMNLFNGKYNCGTCHNGGGGYYGGGSFKDNGLDASYTDIGRGEVTGNAADNGTFVIPNLRNIALTAPYMHDGRYKTLEECVDHYSTGIANSPNLDPILKDKTGKPTAFNISETDKQALVAFMNSLTDFNMTTDPKFSNPFYAK